MQYVLIVMLLANPISSLAAFCPTMNKSNNHHFDCIKTYKDHSCNGKSTFRGAQYDVNLKRVICMYDQGADVYINAGLMHSNTLKYKPGGNWHPTAEHQYTCISNKSSDCPLEE